VRAILLVDHGSRRAEANRVVEDVAELLRAAHAGLIVVAAHLEIATPNIADGFRACVAAGAVEIVAVPYFLGPGRHASVDVPRLVAEAAASHAGVTARVVEPLGAHPALAELIAVRAGIGIVD